MRMTSHIHLVLETEFLNQLKKEAQRKNITLSQLCRLKLDKNLQLDRMEGKLNWIIKKYGSK